MLFDNRRKEAEMQEPRSAYRRRIGDDPDPTGRQELTLQKELTANGVPKPEARRQARAAARHGERPGRRPSSPHREVRPDPLTENANAQEEDTAFWKDSLTRIGKHVVATHGEAAWQAVFTRETTLSDWHAPERHLWIELIRWCQKSPGNAYLRIPSLIFYAILTQSNLRPLRSLAAQAFQRRLWVLQQLGIQVVTEKNPLNLPSVLPLLLHPVEQLTETEFRFRTNALGDAGVTLKNPSYFQLLLAKTRQDFSRLLESR